MKMGDPTPRVVLVIGPHRSGTSSVTRVVSLMGARLPVDLLRPHDTNPSGFWEPAAAVELHDRLFDSFGRSWNDPRTMPDHWQAQPSAVRAAAELDELLDRWSVSDGPIVVKDPRLCRLAPLWFDRLDARGVEAVTVLSTREPHEVADSMRARDGFTADFGAWLWLADSVSAERATRGRRRLTVRYDELLIDTAAVCARIASFTRLDRSDARAARDIAAFLDPSLRHHDADDGISAFAPPIEELTTRAYKGLCGASEPDTDVLDDVAEALAVWQPLLSSVHVQALERAADSHRAQVAITEGQREIAEHTAERLRHQLAQLDAARTELDAAHAELDAAHLELSAELARVRESLASTSGLLYRTQQARSLRAARAVRRWLRRETIDPALADFPADENG
jgi:hypothetical protein